MEGHKPHLLEGFPICIDNKIVHYTCNAPKKEILNKYDIIPIGDKFGSDDKEVLEIPLKVYKKFGFNNLLDKNILKLNSEILMRNLK